jgi:DNA-binding NarL/FixJ family response regulator
VNEGVVRHPFGRKPVGVVTEDPLTAAAVGALLRGRPGIVLLPREREAEADVVIVASDSVTADLLDSLRALAGRTDARVAVILNNPHGTDLFAVAECRIAAVIPRAEVTADRLVRAILTVSRGGGELPAEMQGRLLAQARSVQRDVLAPRGLSPHGLSDREIDVLRLLASGFGVREIGAKLSYSERTVKNVLYALTTRLQLRNRTHAVAYAMRIGAI